MGGLISGLGRFLLGAAIGAAIGAGVGALAAPSSGEELVRTIRGRIRDALTAGEEAEQATRAEMQRQFARRLERSDELPMMRDE